MGGAFHGIGDGGFLGHALEQSWSEGIDSVTRHHPHAGVASPHTQRGTGPGAPQRRGRLLQTAPGRAAGDSEMGPIGRNCPGRN
jgi:hypothetical protein